MSDHHERSSSGSRTGWLALVVLAVVLSACRTAPPPPPPPADTVVAGTDPASPVATFNLTPGETKDFLLQIPAGVAQSNDVLYLELDSSHDGVVELRSSTYWVVMASSATAERFVRGVIPGVPQPSPGAAAVDDQTAAADAQAVVESRACLGPCIVFAPTSSAYYARVVNDSGTTMTADVYLYGYDLQDDGEPQNDSRSTAPVLAATNAGALELLDDTDFWLAAGHLEATMTTVSGGIATNAVVVSAGGVVVAGPYVSGQTFEVYQGESIRVRAASATAAAPARSTYFIETTPLPGNPTRPPDYLEVTANNSGAALDQRNVPAGGMVEYRLIIPATVRSRDVLYVELDANQGLEVRSSSNLSAIASSSSPNSFSSGGSSWLQTGLDDAAALEPLAITATKACAGSCVILSPPSNSLFVRVHGVGAGATFTLYAYGFDLMDDTEPANDATALAPVLVDDVSGAIETIGDLDLWRMATTGTVAFDTVAGGPTLQARVLDVNGVEVPSGQGGGPFTSGQSFGVFAGEYVRVRAANSSQAAVAARSSYFLERTGGLLKGAATREARPTAP